MEQVEIEVKFYVSDTALLEERLLACGAIRQDKVFETNIRFDDDNQRLLSAGQLLRLRRDSRTWLTFKSTPESLPQKIRTTRTDNQFKIYNEIEIGVSDFDDTRKILAALGFLEVQRYEKWRQTFLVETTHLCLDTMPYGIFLEIEGEKEDIRRLADRLGLPWKDRILANYLEMFDYIKNKHALKFMDVTFDNFAPVTVDLSGLLNRFQVGVKQRQHGL